MSDDKEDFYPPFRRLCKRIDVDFNAKLIFSEELCTTGKVVEVSLTGLQIKTECNLPLGPVDLEIEGISLHCERVWASDGAYGLRLLTPSSAWEEFVESISSKS